MKAKKRIRLLEARVAELERRTVVDWTAVPPAYELPMPELPTFEMPVPMYPIDDDRWNHRGYV